MTTPITYRLLPPDEWHKVEPVYAAHGSTLPSTQLGFIAVAEVDGKVVGLGTLQACWHGEPWWVDDEHRGQASILELRKILEGQLAKGATVYVFIPDERVERLLHLHGYEDTGWKVSKKVL